MSNDAQRLCDDGGDIVAIYSSDGTKLVSYAYNAWGVTTKSYSNSGASTTATKNNLTYRGYYYDSDLGMYYLQSRYYDPAICRFINADCYVSTGQELLGYNMFAYCKNNPVMYIDYTGEFPWFAVAVIVICSVVGGFVGNAVANNVEADRNAEILENKEKNTDETNTNESNAEYVMPTSERAKYIVAVTIIGIAVGGTIVSVSGVVGTYIVHSATAEIWFFGNMSGVQMYALGALIRNFSFYIIAPFIEVGEANEEFFEVPNSEEKFQFNNPYIP